MTFLNLLPSSAMDFATAYKIIKCSDLQGVKVEKQNSTTKHDSGLDIKVNGLCDNRFSKILKPPM